MEPWGSCAGTPTATTASVPSRAIPTQWRTASSRRRWSTRRSARRRGRRSIRPDEPEADSERDDRRDRGDHEHRDRAIQAHEGNRECGDEAAAYERLEQELLVAEGFRGPGRMRGIGHVDEHE